MAEAGLPAAAAPRRGGAPVRLSLPVQHVLAILLVAAAIKSPLGIPLYFNGLLLALGVFAIVAVQALQPIFLWP
ncbi:MAG: hypothetical protein R3349_02535, partial [Geminicoccaceae bacterium]|nr:hypothetical protein [Geminicoccaceae bacterium]